ncbi:hypothetical protein F2P81_002279 [Scophthalmus maximus]|uniref:Uncharacterized protein n=1 Tax=Scophthalmus maximus TaxID=52904 RepID=A0A6A4TQ99_SCOMX|nr:hypothetical protein F2P81_002279 [Scophthalmus maximus]
MRNPRLEINAEGVAQVSKAANAHVIIREACRTTFTANVVVIGRVRPGDRGCPSFAAEKEGRSLLSRSPVNIPGLRSDSPIRSGRGELLSSVCFDQKTCRGFPSTEQFPGLQPSTSQAAHDPSNLDPQVLPERQNLGAKKDGKLITRCGEETGRRVRRKKWRAEVVNWGVNRALNPIKVTSHHCTFNLPRRKMTFNVNPLSLGLLCPLSPLDQPCGPLASKRHLQKERTHQKVAKPPEIKPARCRRTAVSRL